jgi:hypothetical protein
VEPPQTPWRPLGQILVEQGLLTDEDLASVLAEQRRTGRKLGEIVIERGLVSWPSLTNALAAQYGLELPTENGFGFGLRIEIERRHGDRRTGGDRREEGDRRQGRRRRTDRRQPPVEETAAAELSPASPEQLEELRGDSISRNGHHEELERLRATHHAWLAELTEKFKEQHGYLAAAATKIEEHEQTLAALRLANEVLNKEIERLRTQLELPRPREPRATAGRQPGRSAPS